MKEFVMPEREPEESDIFYARRCNEAYAQYEASRPWYQKLWNSIWRSDPQKDLEALARSLDGWLELIEEDEKARLYSRHFKDPKPR